MEVKFNALAVLHYQFGASASLGAFALTDVLVDRAVMPSAPLMQPPNQFRQTN